MVSIQLRVIRTLSPSSSRSNDTRGVLCEKADQHIGKEGTGQIKLNPLGLDRRYLCPNCGYLYISPISLPEANFELIFRKPYCFNPSY